MRNFKKFFLVTCLTIILSTSFHQTSSAMNIFGLTDPSGCESKDPFLPNLVICGRNPSSGACAAYSQPCSIGDLVETGSRLLVWVITMCLLIVPLIVMYYGAMMIINQQSGGGMQKLKEIKDRFFKVLLYFILMLAAWLIVRTVIDIFQVDPRINTFLIDENGQTVHARTFNTN